MSACPQCVYFASKVIETRRLKNGWVRRSRRCLRADCGKRWVSYEMPAQAVDTQNFDAEALREIERL